MERKEKELMARVKLPADAEAYRIRQVSEGRRHRAIALAEGGGQAVRLTSTAEAGAAEAIGKAEALGMRLQADAYAQYGEAAKLAMVLDSLPTLAREVSTPLQHTSQILILSGDSQKKVGGSLAGLPSQMEALTSILDKYKAADHLEHGAREGGDNLRLTSAFSRVPSGGSSSRPLYNIEEKDDKVGNDLGPKRFDSGPQTLDPGLERLDSGLERLAASVKEDFSRVNSNNSGLDLAPSKQIVPPRGRS